MEVSGITQRRGEAECCRQKEQDTWKRKERMSQCQSTDAKSLVISKQMLTLPHTLSLSRMFTEILLDSSKRDLLAWIWRDQKRNRCDVSLNF